MTQAKVTFSKKLGFRKELNRRVEAYFQNEGLSQRDNPQMYLKTAIICAWVISSWMFVLFVPAAVPVKLLGCVILALGIAAFSFNVGHDANHGGYSANQRVNRILGLTYDFIGLSSYLWRYRHNVLHHTYTNILGHDVEIHGDGLVRMSPTQEHQWFQRFQHIYTWFIYLFIPFYWSVYDVYLILIKGKYHDHVIPKPKTSELITLLGVKVLWVGYVIGLPLAIGYTPLQVLLGVSLTYMTYGLAICVIFMLAHVMETAEFLTPDPVTQTIDDEWAICQVRTTVDFATDSPFFNWYLGGLNHQVTHHLFPQICHIHYPQISKIVREVCEEFGVEYKVYPTFTGAIASNYRWLKAMGCSPETQIAEAK
ncbi:MAG: acyl-CoA desaturase [Oscillatoria princeps RMCB-10]|jgi:linoleoyl-CoA desaturase|nr:acyl-CoA desaturase [Oscillatoria princeps RMCB-10]